jgi:hypothetical protein
MGGVFSHSATTTVSSVLVGSAIHIGCMVLGMFFLGKAAVNAPKFATPVAAEDGA